MGRPHGRLTLAILGFLILVYAPLLVLAQTTNSRHRGGAVEGWVSSITGEILYLDGQEFPISSDVRVFVGSETGWELTLKTITDVGHIHRARIHLDRGQVHKIIVLEVQQ